MKTLPFNLAVNPVSFGQVSTAILRELKNQGQQVILSPIAGQVDLSTQPEDPEFESWLQEAITNFTRTHDRKNRVFKLWHLNGSLESFSDEQILFSFYELDNPTREEINIIKNNYKVIFSCSETVDKFQSLGCKNVSYMPLAFDSHNFYKTNKKYFSDDRITFSVTGKFESRKNHEKMIKAWVKKYGNNRKYSLQCAVWNPFLQAQQNNQIAQSLLGGQSYYNVVFSGYMHKNENYNDFLNSSDIILGMSGGEGWGLPEFQSVCLGKHAVLLNASAYKDWANEENSVLVEPNGKRDVYDGMFFHKGQPYNQGQIYDFDEDDFISGCEEAVKKVQASRNNDAGEKLKDEFTYSKLVNSIVSDM